MAILYKDNLIQYFMPAVIERLGQNTEVFNEKSRGAIRLTGDRFTGDFLEETFYKSLAAAQARIQIRTNPNPDAPVVDLTQDAVNSVKVAGRFGPVRYEGAQLSWLAKPTGEGIAKFSEFMANALIADMVNTAISVAVAAFNNNTAVVANAGTNPITLSAMNKAHAKFGDSSASIVADVVSGKIYHELISQNILNTANLFQAGNITLVEWLGKVVIVTDAPGLYKATPTPAQDYVLGLADSAIVVTDAAQGLITNIEEKNGKERIETLMQSNYDFSIRLKGYKWGGSSSPSNAQLFTGTNWTQVASDVKDTAGVLAIGQAV